MLCKDVEFVVEQEGLAPLPEAAQAHVATCSHCQGFVADLAAVVPAHGERSSGWHGFSDLFRSRALATATVGLLIIAAGALQLRKPPDASLETNGSIADPVWQVPFAQTAKVLNEQEIDLRNMQPASTSAVDTSFRQNLQQVDDFIADCERRVSAAPQDELAREYLSNAYQQKAELLSAMMDREGSMH